MCEYLARRAVDIRWLIDTSGTQRLLLHGITLPVSCCQSVYTERDRERERLGEIARELSSWSKFGQLPSLPIPVLGKKDYPLTSIFTSNHPFTIRSFSLGLLDFFSSRFQ